MFRGRPMLIDTILALIASVRVDVEFESLGRPLKNFVCGTIGASIVIRIVVVTHEEVTDLEYRSCTQSLFRILHEELFS
jgi:hypothetical protein